MTTVSPYDLHLQGRELFGRLGGADPHHGVHVAIEAHGAEDGQGGSPSCSLDGSLGLVEIAHGLDQNHVRSALRQGTGLLGEHLHRFLESEGPQRLHQDSAGPD